MWPFERQPKPSEYADHMLRALIEAYDDPDDDTARAQGLSAAQMAVKARAWYLKWIKVSPTRSRAVESGSMDAVADAVAQLLEREHIYEASDGAELYKPTSEGVAYLKEQFVPWRARVQVLALGSLKWLALVTGTIIAGLLVFFIQRLVGG